MLGASVLISGAPGRQRQPRPEPARRLVDLEAAGAYLSISRNSVRNLVFNGVLPAVRLPCPRAGDGREIRRLLIDRRDLDVLIDRSKESLG